MAKHNILIVEDSPTMRQLIIFSLKRLSDCSLVEATDGVDGWKKLSGQNFDLILTDINMPVMDGLKLVSLIRNDEKKRSIPIIIITTEGAEEDKKRGLALGANDYIAKPIQSHTLLDVVKKYIH
ncbi:MAG: response regulator [Nitrospirae bacterium CG_4_9_14_3_um_filter_53_35]|nr:MAG: response regulator [Nitrospirae bacterium CG_4_8_14_3_um_filter_50_41]PJA74286.1 MAG: response regulator [Nitrospirae bacterium CG_4_9_14_3_um_filter_53_35]